MPFPSSHISVMIVSPGIDDAGEADGHRREPRRVVAGVLLQDRAADVAEGAEAVQDRAVVTGHLREVGVDVQRVAVAGEAVDHRLGRQRRHLDGLVRRAVGRDVAGLGPALAAEAAGAAHEDAGACS